MIFSNLTTYLERTYHLLTFITTKELKFIAWKNNKYISLSITEYFIFDTIYIDTKITQYSVVIKNLDSWKYDIHCALYKIEIYSEILLLTQLEKNLSSRWAMLRQNLSIPLTDLLTDNIQQPVYVCTVQ